MRGWNQNCQIFAQLRYRAKPSTYFTWAIKSSTQCLLLVRPIAWIPSTVWLWIITFSITFLLASTACLGTICPLGPLGEASMYCVRGCLTNHLELKVISFRFYLGKILMDVAMWSGKMDAAQYKWCRTRVLIFEDLDSDTDSDVNDSDLDLDTWDSAQNCSSPARVHCFFDRISKRINFVSQFNKWWLETYSAFLGRVFPLGKWKLTCPFTKC